jgi:hypothetical protein
VVHTLRDDVAPKRNLHGTLDLRGTMQDGKRSRSKKDARGRTISYYRDDWLTVKTKLYDGSMLRFSVVKRLKIREGYQKRGRVSGKVKYKPPVVKGEGHRIDIRVSANPQLYTVTPAAAPRVGQRVGNCVIDSVTVDGGLLRVVAASAGLPPHAELLELLRVTYATLRSAAA